MAVRTTINISLTRELNQFVTARVASGRYQSASEVVRDGLRLLEEREAAREAVLEDLRTKLRVGLEEARRGELLDGEAVFKRLEQRVSRRRSHAR